MNKKATAQHETLVRVLRIMGVGLIALGAVVLFDVSGLGTMIMGSGETRQPLGSALIIIGLLEFIACRGF